MAEVARYRPEDRRSVEALYRRVFGHDAAVASRLRWDWQYRLNPNNPGQEPEIWIAREGTAIIGQYATMPVKLHVAGRVLRTLTVERLFVGFVGFVAKHRDVGERSPGLAPILDARARGA